MVIPEDQLAPIAQKDLEMIRHSELQRNKFTLDRSAYKDDHLMNEMHHKLRLALNGTFPIGKLKLQ